MENNQQAIQSIERIKNMMERSSKFLSLSGLSGVFAGIYALIGAYVAYRILYWGQVRFTDYGSVIYKPKDNYVLMLILTGLIVLMLSIATAYILTKRKSKRLGLKMWDSVAKRMFINFMTPLTAGGLLCLILLFKYGTVGLIVPLTLIFYGLALVNASKFSFDELRFLGYCEIILGLGATYFLGYGLVFWALGFGVLHIIYGIIMFQKHH